MNKKNLTIDAVAVKIQRTVRLKNARRKYKLLQWAKQNWAAKVIQLAFRKFIILKATTYNHLRKVRDRRISGNGSKNKSSNINISTTVKDCFQKVINAKGSFDDKMTCWRLAVELRRGHNFQTTDTCIKAILESEADIKQAVTLLGIAEFSIRHYSELPKHTKKLFLFDNNCLLFGTNKKNSEALHKSLGILGPEFSESIRNSLGEMNKGAGIEAIRTLKRIQRRQALIDTINLAVNKSYFSKHHVGSKYQQQPYPKLS